MSMMLRIAGLSLALFCWFNPMEFDALLVASLFILGFDMMGTIDKLAVFVFSFAFPSLGTEFIMFSWTLLMIFMGELLLMVLKIGKAYSLVLRPLIILVAAFLSIGAQPALVIAGIDLLVNLTQKN